MSLMGCLLLAACGFQMRGATPLPFETLYTNIPDNTRFGAGLRRAIQATSPGTQLLTSPKTAQAQLQQISKTQTTRELVFNAQGRVETYELILQFTFRVVDASGHILLPDTTLETTREMSYSDQFSQAKTEQGQTLFQNMEQSMINRIMRRLTAPSLRIAVQKAQHSSASP